MNHKPALFIGAIAAVLLAVAAVPAARAAAAADQKTAQRATQLRRSLFSLMSYNFKPMGDLLRRAPDPGAAVVLERSKRLEALVPMINELFATDTRDFQVDTWASDRIWADPQGFRGKAAAYGKAVGAMKVAAAGGDSEQILAAITKVASACKACHNDYIRE